MYSKIYNVTATFLRADAGFQKWAAFKQHIKGGTYDYNVFIVYSRKPQLSQEDENAAKDALKTVKITVKGVQISPEASTMWSES